MGALQPAQSGGQSPDNATAVIGDDSTAVTEALPSP